MNRTPRARMTALLAAVLFLLYGAGDVFGAHPCPHHAAIGAPEYAAAASVPDAHQGHAAHGADPSAPAGHDQHAHCTCAGVCPVSTGPVPLAARPLAALPLLQAPAAPAAYGAQEALPSRFVPHFLPFAQAPPPQA